jgi:nitrite reductase/ring-hydroxylating ferredoxin subunit
LEAKVLEDAEFVPVLDESDLIEGQMKEAKAKDTPVLLVKLSGKIYAYDDRCPHMQCKLSHGTLDGGMVVCSCHEWRFKVETGEYEKWPQVKLVPLEWKVEAGKIWVMVEE